MLRKSTAAVLLIVLAVFSLGSAVEVLHPVEEAPHAEHPQLSGTNVTAPLPCDEGPDAHRHHCLHSQQLMVTAGLDARTLAQVLDHVEDAELLEPAGRTIVRFLRRGPPSC